MKKYFLVALTVLSVLGQSCKSVDLRTDYLRENAATTLEEKGRELLRQSRRAMGYDRLGETEVYEAEALYNWKGIWLMMPMNAFPGNNNNKLKLRFATNSFDGQLEYLEGRKKGLIQGLQSWEGYKIKRNNGELKRHEHDRYLWGLATYHYLTEAPLHIPEAEIVRYAGTKELDGIAYELVYITWGTEAPNKQYDRMLAYINPKNKFIDLLEVTINDFFLSMPKGMQHATARYEREKTSIGAYLPSNVTIQIKSPKKKSNKVYSYKMSNYQFDSFDKEKLYPIEGLEYYGFSKPNE